jgi:hypothetical protein
VARKIEREYGALLIQQDLIKGATA